MRVRSGFQRMEEEISGASEAFTVPAVAGIVERDGGTGGMARIGVRIGTRPVIRPSILYTGSPVGSLCLIACIMLSRRRSASFKMVWIIGSLIENPMVKSLYKMYACKYQVMILAVCFLLTRWSLLSRCGNHAVPNLGIL